MLTKKQVAKMLRGSFRRLWSRDKIRNELANSGPLDQAGNLLREWQRNWTPRIIIIHGGTLADRQTFFKEGLFKYFWHLSQNFHGFCVHFKWKWSLAKKKNYGDELFSKLVALLSDILDVYNDRGGSSFQNVKKNMANLRSIPEVIQEILSILGPTFYFALDVPEDWETQRDLFSTIIRSFVTCGDKYLFLSCSSENLPLLKELAFYLAQEYVSDIDISTESGRKWQKQQQETADEIAFDFNITDKGINRAARHLLERMGMLHPLMMIYGGQPEQRELMVQTMRGIILGKSCRWIDVKLDFAEKPYEALAGLIYDIASDLVHNPWSEWREGRLGLPTMKANSSAFAGVFLGIRNILGMFTRKTFQEKKYSWRWEYQNMLQELFGHILASIESTLVLHIELSNWIFDMDGDVHRWRHDLMTTLSNLIEFEGDNYRIIFNIEGDIPRLILDIDRFLPKDLSCSDRIEAVDVGRILE